MTMQTFFTSQAPAPVGPYSQGVAAGGLLFLAGQGPFDESGALVGETFAEQVHRTFQNLAAVAAEAGTDLGAVVRLGAYLNSLDDFAEFNAIAAEYLPQPYPARTTIQSDLLGFLIELDAVLVLDDD
jgi:reactive intermediate/imine deaminase